jgi:hypothetical protein
MFISWPVQNSQTTARGLGASRPRYPLSTQAHSVTLHSTWGSRGGVAPEGYGDAHAISARPLPLGPGLRRPGNDQARKRGDATTPDASRTRIECTVTVNQKIN